MPANVASPEPHPRVHVGITLQPTALNQGNARVTGRDGKLVRPQDRDMSTPLPNESGWSSNDIVLSFGDGTDTQNNTAK